MKIGIRYPVLKEIMKTNKAVKEKVGWLEERKLESNDYKEDNIFILDLTVMAKASLEQLRDELIKLEVGIRTIQTVENWLKNIEDPVNSVIVTLKQLERTLIMAVKGNNLHWVMRENEDGNWVPKAATNVNFKTPPRSAPYVSMQLKSINLNIKHSYHRSDDESGDDRKFSVDDDSVHFDSNDLYDWEGTEEQQVYSVEDFEETAIRDTDEDDDDDEDESGDKKKKSKKKAAPKRKRKNLTLVQLLANKGVTLINKEHIDQYIKDLNLWNSITKQTGKVYTADGIIWTEPDGQKGYGKWQHPNEENRISKFVINGVEVEDLEQTDTGTFGTVSIPTEPYIRAYNLTKYSWATIHVNNLKKYVFDKDVIEKLVLSDEKKKLLNSLIGNKNKFADIISGKSGGMIILCTGLPGLGKTLTAEVYSELMELPLYNIQSSQLGLDVDTIEKNLDKVLIRADRWGAILLIDEADCYVYKRGTDILQNCIVGTFLRVLEYYNGILFLTTNRGDILDDAIMSRVTAHVRYDYPTKTETFKLWSVLCINFGRKISMNTVYKIWEAYEPICGRDIRNLLKMLSKYNSDIKEVTFEMVEELKEFIPFLKERKQVEKAVEVYDTK